MKGPIGPILRGRRGEGGATAVEYVVMLASLVAACMAAIVLLGQGTRDAFDAVQPAFSETVATEPDEEWDEDKCGDKDSADDANCGSGND